MRDSNQIIKVEDLSLKDFLQFRKEFSKTPNQDDSLSEFKLKISKIDYDLFEKKTINNFFNSKS